MTIGRWLIVDEGVSFELLGEPGDLVSSVRYETRGSHSILVIWNRGGFAGTLTINAADLGGMLQRLMPSAFSREAACQRGLPGVE